MKDGQYVPPRWMGWLERVRFMPRIPFTAWWVIWIIAFAGSLYQFAGKGLGWWGYSDEVLNACSLVFFLLAFTPFQLRTTHWLARGRLPDGSWTEWGLVTRRSVRRLRGHPSVQLRRIVMMDGIEQEDRREQ